MAGRICQLLRDDVLRKAFGARAAARAGALFSEQSVLNQYSQLYQRLAGKTAAAGRPSAIPCPAGAARVSKRGGRSIMTTHALQIDWINSVEELRSAADNWDDLWQRSDVAAPTARAAIVAQWVELFCARSDFRAVVVKDQEKFLAALPLVRTKLYRVLSASTIPANGWLPSGGGLLLDREMATDDVMDLLLEAIAGLPHQVLWLDEVALSFPHWQTFWNAVRRAGMAREFSGAVSGGTDRNRSRLASLPSELVSDTPSQHGAAARGNSPPRANCDSRSSRTSQPRKWNRNCGADSRSKIVVGRAKPEAPFSLGECSPASFSKRSSWRPGDSCDWLS